MIGVDNKVQPHKINKVLVSAIAKHVGEVVTVIGIGLERSDLAIFVDVAIDLRSNGGELGNEVHGILIGVAPVLLLVNTLSIGLGELGLVLESSDGQRELGHRVKGVRASVNELLDELGNLRAGSPLGGESLDLLSGRDLAGQQQPENPCNTVSTCHLPMVEKWTNPQEEAPRRPRPWEEAPGIRESVQSCQEQP